MFEIQNFFHLRPISYWGTVVEQLRDDFGPTERGENAEFKSEFEIKLKDKVIPRVYTIAQSQSTQSIFFSHLIHPNTHRNIELTAIFGLVIKHIDNGHPEWKFKNIQSMVTMIHRCTSHCTQMPNCI